jgi:hypothetical protein
MQAADLRAAIERQSADNARALRERFRSVELTLRAGFVETVPGILVAELDELPDDDTTINLLQLVREAEGRAS